MDKQFLFERNLLSLSLVDAELCSRLSAAETTLGRYRFVESRSGTPLPAWVDSSGCAHTLHSLASPEKEAGRLIGTLNGEGYVIFLGLGSGFYVEAALRQASVAQALVIDFDINAAAELLCHHDYIQIFNDERFSILIDPSPEEIRAKILSSYLPALHGGLKTFPLRPRTDFDTSRFAPAAAVIKKTLESIAEDYSVQSCFGKRWFSNIIHNVIASEKQNSILPPVRIAAVCAAGPSLDSQMHIIKAKRKTFFLIATDTSLPALLGAALMPDAVISIDCQHISYYHFIGTAVKNTPLFLDLASPPLVAGRSEKVFFFSGGHPLTNYISANYRTFPVLDTSGANVTFAGVTLAEKLGAQQIHIFGADFSYPNGAAYSRGAYFYPFFFRRQNRLQPTESMLCHFLFKSPSLIRIKSNTRIQTHTHIQTHTPNDDRWYYETKPLMLYRRRLEEKSRTLNAVLLPAEGAGAPIAVRKGRITPPKTAVFQIFASGRPYGTAKDFLAGYAHQIRTLPPLTENITRYIENLSAADKHIFATLLPTAAAFRYRDNAVTLDALLEDVKSFCALKLKRLLKMY
jgi:hypothetical protein